MRVEGFTFYTLASEQSCEIEEKRSRFISFSKLVRSEEEAKTFIASIKAKHPSSSHVCYAYILGQNSEISHSNDDGEPSGSAGIAILETLKKHKLTNSIVVVVRYFGGKKLGVSALYRAYKRISVDVIKKSDYFSMILCSIYEFRFTYNDFAKVGAYLRDNDLPILKQDYSDVVRIEVALPSHNEQLHFSDLKTIIGGRFMNNKLRSAFVRFTNEI